MRLVDKEIRIMSFLDHPHVIHLEEVYEDDTRVCFVMELAQGGEVFDRLIEKVRLFFFQIKVMYSVKAIQFCEIFPLLLSYAVPVKSKEKILQNFVAFSEIYKLY